MVLASVVCKKSDIVPIESSNWDALKEVYLQMGSVRVVDPKEGRFAVVRYDRSKDAPLANSWLRSVVIDKQTCLPVCLSPPKSTDFPKPDQDWSPVKNSTVQYFVDGTMVNLFWVPGEDQPHVVTRSRIGADNSFYGDRSFADMLKDAVKFLADKGTPGFRGDLNDLKPWSAAETPVFVSVVLQHPENRVVTEVKDPRITVIHIGKQESDGSCTVLENPKDWNDTLAALAPTSLTIPVESLASYEVLQQWVEAQSQELGAQWQGIVLKNNGVRYRIRAKAYSKMRSLRGNEGTRVERFCRLRGTRAIRAYLQAYPDDEKVFYELEGKLRAATRKLLNLYVNTFKFKKQPYHELPWPYKHHVSVLHNKYKDELKPTKKTIDLNFVIEYVNTLNVVDMSNLFKETRAKAATSE